jgi:hypothetical protein
VSGTRCGALQRSAANDPAGDGVSEARGRRLIVAPAAEIVGRQVRALLDDGWRVLGFVGDPDADREALDEFLRDVHRPES